MTEARPLVEPFLPGDSIERIALGIATGYRNVNKLMLSHLALSRFQVGMDQRPYLLRALIDFELKKIADTTDGFFSEVKLNAARNCRWLHLFRDRLAITQHFMGRKNFRPMASYARNRQPLYSRNSLFLDFGDEERAAELFQGDGYVQFHHGGGAKPEFIAMVIPTDDQNYFTAKSSITVPEVESTVAPEEIVEQIGFQLRDDIFNSDQLEGNEIEEDEIDGASHGHKKSG